METMPNKELGVALADDFIKAAALAGINIPRPDVEVEFLCAPHRPPSSLPDGRMAVYVFMLGDRCLKVGKANQKSLARYCSQHYGLNAPSTLAKSLLTRRKNFDCNGLNEQNVKAWICEKTTRLNFLVPSRYGIFALSLLEAFLQCRLQPEFEGFASQRV